MQEENIYNLIPKEYAAQTKGQKYHSQFKKTAKQEYIANKAPARTMGPARVELRQPQEFLKKHEKEPILPETTEGAFKYVDGDKKKPPVPKAGDQPILGLKTTKNYITQNAVDNIMSVPKKPDKVFVDTKKGDKHPLVPSGLEVVHIHKKEYGKTPSYLLKRREEVIQAQEEYDHYVAEHFKRGAMRQLTEEEREEILDGLKTNWELIHHEFQGLSVVTDTASKKNRKERMETEMKQLERDIETVERHNIIYIADN